MLTVAHVIRCVVYNFVSATIVAVVNLSAVIISIDIGVRIPAKGVKYFKKILIYKYLYSFYVLFKIYVVNYYLYNK